MRMLQCILMADSLHALDNNALLAALKQILHSSTTTNDDTPEPLAIGEGEDVDMSDDESRSASSSSSSFETINEAGGVDNHAVSATSTPTRLEQLLALTAAVATAKPSKPKSAMLAFSVSALTGDTDSS